MVWGAILWTLWGNICCYNWKQLPSGLLWSFSLGWKSTYKSARSRCYHGDHSAKWKSWKMPIIRLYVVLKAWVVKHMFLSQIWSQWRLSSVPNVWPDILCHSLFIKQKVCYKAFLMNISIYMFLQNILNWFHELSVEKISETYQ